MSAGRMEVASIESGCRLIGGIPSVDVPRYGCRALYHYRWWGVVDNNT